jgi:acetyltransferase EpsM
MHGQRLETTSYAQRNSPIQTIVVGAGGHGAEVASYILDLIRMGWTGSLAGFLDDHAQETAPGCGRMLGRIDDFVLRAAIPSQPAGYIIAVGSNRLRSELAARMASRFGPEAMPWSLIHPAAYVGGDVEIGAGTMIAPGAIATARIRLGRHVILNVKASVSHDAEIGDFANINPAATICGNVTIGEGAYIGAGAVIKQNVAIGAWSTIGAGAVVLSDIPAHSTAVGVPARVIKRAAAAA